MFLFIDTTYNLTIGLLNQSYNWVDFCELETNRSSELLHFEVHSLLQKHNESVDRLEGVIYVSGPGSYTGMRVAEGFINILELENINTYSFYLFDVPQFFYKSGVFVANAFKNELFVYRWSEDQSKKELLPVGEWKEQEDCYSIDGKLGSRVVDFLKTDGTSFFKMIVESKVRKKLYYYRTLDQEFKVAK